MDSEIYEKLESEKGFGQLKKDATLDGGLGDYMQTNYNTTMLGT